MSSMYASDGSILKFCGLLFCAQEIICFDFSKHCFDPSDYLLFSTFKCQTVLFLVFEVCCSRDDGIIFQEKMCYDLIC
jgi:hypothetical protein